jgi:putative lipoprotein
MNLLSKALLSVSTIILISCAQETNTSLTGEILYSEDVALPEQTILTIQLVDISKQDVKGKVIAERIIKNPGQVPIDFDIQYNPDDILSANTYSLKAKIEDKGSYLYTTDKIYPVITNGITNKIKMNVVSVKTETAEVELITPKEIDAYISKMQKVLGDWEMGDASSVIEAYYTKDELKLIVEQMNMGDYGSSEYKYYFKEGYLFYHEQNGKRITPNSNQAADVNVIMHFNSFGDLVASSKKVNLQQVELHDIEAPGVLKHCELIVEIANQNFNQNL